MKLRFCAAVFAVLVTPLWCAGQNLRGSTTGPTKAKGYDHPNQFFSALRMDEFKAHIAVELQGAIFKRGYTGGFSGSITTHTGGATVSNIYTNPQEDTSIGVRHIPMTIPLLGEITRYEKVLKKFPPKIVIGFAGN